MFLPLALTANAQVMGRTYQTKMKDIEDGLKFRLSNGRESVETPDQTPVAETHALSEAETAKLIGRLGEIKKDPSDQTDFAKRIGTLPAPKTGEKIAVPFPADGEMAKPPVDGEKQPLIVIRYTPEGDVSLAPDLSVTFSHPMVSVTSQEEAAQYAPVQLSPQVEGRWRWLGTKTLMFDTTKRFPMATEYTARVPAGTKSATGEVLPKDVSWTFRTPPPKLTAMYPQNNIVRRNALIFAAFDQAIDPASVLKNISVTGNGKALQTRLATEEEIGGDEIVSNYIKQQQPGRWLVFRAVGVDGSIENGLPGNAAINIAVKKGTPSAEGPLKTIEQQSFSFRTYGPLQFQKAICGWEGKGDCSPFDNWYIQFNNPIDSSKFTENMVKIEPAIEGVKIFPSGNSIYISGVKKGRTTYKITVDGSIMDQFGQTLGKTVTATIKVGSAPPTIYSQGGTMVILDPAAKPVYSVYSTNYSALKVKVYKVQPTDWNKFTQFYRRINYDDGQKFAIPGSLVVDKVVNIENVADELVETRVDIAKALDGGFGNVIVDIEPTVRRNKNDRQRVVAWVQSTNIGLDAFVDNEELVGFATELKTGNALAGVQLSIYPNAGTPLAANTEPDNRGYLAQAWDWLTGANQSGGPSVESFDAEGTSVETETVEPAQTNVTGDNGILRIALSSTTSPDQPNLLIAKRGKDVAFLPENSDYYWQDSGNWYKKKQIDSLRWFVFDDRKMYKPNEEVSVKGYIRQVTVGKLGDVEALGDVAHGLTWVAKDPRGNEIAKGEGNLNAFGAFDLKFKLPDNVNLGNANIELQTQTSLNGGSFYHQFQIQEFRRPEFEVSAKVETEGPHFIGGSVEVSAAAKYYAGGGLPNADVNWTVTATPTNYTPPNRGDFTFGTWVPWWYGYNYYRGYGGGQTQTFQGKTDASGNHFLKIDLDSVKPPRPYNITASSAVMDVNRQTWSGSTSMIVHPADLYVGIKTPRTFVQKGEQIIVESIVSDLDGKLIAGRDVEIKALLKDYVFEKGSWIQKTVDEQFCNVKSTEAAQECKFIAKQGGVYTITATVMDDRERFNESQITVWVPGGKQPPNRNVEQQEVQIIPSKKDFKAGDTAELLVIAPFSPAEGILTLRREGIVSTQRFKITDSSITLKIPIEEKYLPNIYAQVDLVGVSQRMNDDGTPATIKGADGKEIEAPKRPAYATGNINLPISTDDRKLTVTAEPKDTTLVPGGETSVSVVVKDNNGNPVPNSEVAVVVVDESVLALSGYSISDPLGVFYTGRGAGVMDYHSRKDVLLRNVDDLKQPSPPPSPTVDTTSSEMSDSIKAKQVGILPKGENFTSMLRVIPGTRPEAKSGGFAVDGASGAENTFVVDGQEVDEAGKPIQQRSNFDALAVFAPSVKTDSSGRATVAVKLPDNLTRYRITAVAVDQAKRFGKGESNLTAKKPLMVRPSAPRFMNFGDKVELPVVVQNQTDKDMTVNVAIRATNAALGQEPPEGGTQNGGTQNDGTQNAGKQVVIKANDRAEVRFPVSAVKAGTARFQIAVTSGSMSDAAEISLPVWTPATTEAFATYGTTDKNGAIIQPVQAPGDVFPQFGGLEVTTSSTQLQELTDAFLNLYRYPFECSEQVSSRMISIAALKDVLTAFKAKEIPSEAEIKASFAKDVRILQSRQRSDGSFGLWKRDGERYDYPFVSVHAAHALILAKAKGFDVPDEMLNRSKSYLKDVEKHYPSWYGPEIRWTISAYALYVRDLLGDKDVGKTKKLFAEATVEKMPFEALGWTLSVLANDKNSAVEVEAIKRFLMNRTTETAATANFVTNYGDNAWVIMYSNRRADGVLLEALIKADPNNDLIPKLVRGLLDHRKKGAWSNTQENVFILLALDKYFNAFEKVTPDFLTRIWLGNTYAGEQKFQGRSIDSNLLTIPMSYLIDQGGKSNLIMDKQGAGRLYYRIGMKYAPKNLNLKPADYGFTVLRSYEAVDDPADVVQNADGTWTIKSGARVRVRLTMVAQARRYHVALVDYLPAGLEILNPELAVTEKIPEDKTPNTSVIEYGSTSFGGGWWWRQNWFEHQNFRDERAEAFASLLWEGVYNYSYVTRATTPGVFIAPPAKAEEMYHPETFGRTGTDFVTVK